MVVVARNAAQTEMAHLHPVALPTLLELLIHILQLLLQRGQLAGRRIERQQRRAGAQARPQSGCSHKDCGDGACAADWRG